MNAATYLSSRASDLSDSILPAYKMTAMSTRSVHWIGSEPAATRQVTPTPFTVLDCHGAAAGLCETPDGAARTAAEWNERGYEGAPFSVGTEVRS